jgi:hypothetical protein
MVSDFHDPPRELTNPFESHGGSCVSLISNRNANLRSHRLPYFSYKGVVSPRVVRRAEKSAHHDRAQKWGSSQSIISLTLNLLLGLYFANAEGLSES